ncbi:hypothetical protein Tco_0895683 [Tanacetum coccineum]|uniref:Uncharacterized protein n=1 Tax=Tanacetum coccineum TaxID=301880 RepID=A0ABQ5CFA0_9ASTR
MPELEAIEASLNGAIFSEPETASAVNGPIEIEENVNPSVMDSVTDSETDPDVGINFTLYSDSDSEYSDKSVDYLSQGEDELMDLRKRKTKAKKALKSSNKQTLPDKVVVSSRK